VIDGIKKLAIVSNSLIFLFSDWWCEYLWCQN